jgi:acyl-CoA thioester hydrolase
MATSLKDSTILVRTDEMKMRWGEMDSLSHMNNVAYMRYFEESRVAWFHELEINYNSNSEGPILGTITCRYLKSALYPTTFGLTSYVGKLGRSSFTMYHQLFNLHDESEVFAEAEATLVWADILAGKSRPIPNWLRLVIQGD